MKLENKICWRTDCTQDVKTLFYPSVLKKITEYKNWDQFTFVENTLDEQHLQNDFFPLYQKHIASKPNYRFNINDTMAKIRGYIEATGEDQKRYKIISILQGARVLGGLIYREVPHRLNVAYRVIDRDFVKEMKLPISLDYYVEYMLIKKVQEQGLQEISHGQSANPSEGALGLVLFKLKVGSRPKRHHLANKDSISFPPHQLHTYLCVFTHLDSNDYYHKLEVYYSSANAPSDNLRIEAEKICTWAGLTFAFTEGA